jgi:hypothetical protein
VKNDFYVLKIDSYQTYDWLIHKHYAKRIPSISFAFGLYDKNNILQGVCTIGKPPSPSLCDGICGKENSQYVFELNRLCVNEGLPKNTLSMFVGKVINLLPKIILVSYADTSQNHHGYIYQATNWIYTGLSDKRSEWRKKNSNSHSKSICDKYTTEFMRNNDNFQMIERPRKHRYVYFIGSKSEKKYFNKSLNYKTFSYPKGENQRYDATYTPNTQGLLFK